MNILGLVLFFLFGLAVGSFLNVCIDRLPSGMSIISPPSHCPSCHHKLLVKDLIPVFSYLWLKGHCRYCNTPIPKRLLWVELSTGALFTFLYWQYSLSWQLAITIFYFALLLILMVIDLEQGIIPNKIIYPGIVISLIISLITEIGLIRAVIGGGIGFVVMLMPALIYKGGMGFGDVKMAGLIGLITGFPLIFVALFLGFVSGGLTAGLLLWLKLKKRKETIPFAPFLSLATMVTLLWGNNILSWYLKLL